MAFELKTRGIIVHGHSYGEGDRILILLTEDAGVVKAAAKAARQPGSRWGARCEPMILADLHLAGRSKHQDILRVTGVSPVEFWPTLRESLVGVATATYLLEMVLALLPDREPQPRTFTLALKALRALDAGEHPELVCAAFEQKAFHQAGFSPALDRCAHCDTPLSAGKFSPTAGGLLCRDCGTGKDGTVLSSVQARVLKDLRDLDLKSLKERPAMVGTIRSLRPLVERYTDEVLDRPLKSRRFLDHLLGLTREKAKPALKIVF